MEWHKSDERPPLKVYSVPCVGGIILVDYLSKGTTINVEYYFNLLSGILRQALIKKLPGKPHNRPLIHLIWHLTIIICFQN